jgi:hypothetical protein
MVGPTVSHLDRCIFQRIYFRQNEDIPPGEPQIVAVYKPRDGDARVRSGRREIYRFHEEVMHATFETYLIDITWAPRMSWANDTDIVQTYTYTCTTGLAIINGSEVNNGFSLAATYQGASVTIDNQERVFKATETTESRTVTVNLSVPPRSILIFYQRRYKFRNLIFFVLHCWNRHLNVGLSQSYKKASKECEVEIMSEDYLTTQAQLSGTRIIRVNTVEGVQDQDETMELNQCTQRCRDKIWDMRVGLI